MRPDGTLTIEDLPEHISDTKGLITSMCVFVCRAAYTVRFCTVLLAFVFISRCYRVNRNNSEQKDSIDCIFE